jgi:hypothetical protein
VLTPKQSEEYSQWLLGEALPLGAVAQHEAVRAYDRFGEGWELFDWDSTSTVLRQRALPVAPELPEPQRRCAQFAEPGHPGRKRGEVQLGRATLEHSGTSQWLGLWCAAGNAPRPEQTRSAFEAMRCYCERHALDPERALLRCDGQAATGMRSLLACRGAGLQYLTRLSHYEIFEWAEVLQHLEEVRFGPVEDSLSGPRREAAELGSLRLVARKKEPEESQLPSLRSRVVISRFPATETKRGVGIVRGPWQYELFGTSVPQERFSAGETVTAYYGRCAQENRFLQEDRQLGLDRIFSYHLAGQHLACAIGLFCWNVRLALGARLHGLEPGTSQGIELRAHSLLASPPSPLPTLCEPPTAAAAAPVAERAPQSKPAPSPLPPVCGRAAPEAQPPSPMPTLCGPPAAAAAAPVAESAPQSKPAPSPMPTLCEPPAAAAAAPVAESAPQSKPAPSPLLPVCGRAAPEAQPPSPLPPVCGPPAAAVAAPAAERAPQSKPAPSPLPPVCGRAAPEAQPPSPLPPVCGSPAAAVAAPAAERAPQSKPADWLESLDTAAWFDALAPYPRWQWDLSRGGLLCPNDLALRLNRLHPDLQRQSLRVHFRAPFSACSRCSLRSECTDSLSPRFQKELTLRFHASHLPNIDLATLTQSLDPSPGASSAPAPSPKPSALEPSWLPPPPQASSGPLPARWPVLLPIALSQAFTQLCLTLQIVIAVLLPEPQPPLPPYIASGPAQRQRRRKSWQQRLERGRLPPQTTLHIGLHGAGPRLTVLDSPPIHSPPLLASS